MFRSRSATCMWTWKRLACGAVSISATPAVGIRFRRACFAGAAVLGEVGNESVHASVVGAHADHPALADVADQAGAAQHVEVCGERGGGDVEAFAQFADGEAIGAGFDQGAISGQAVFLAEGAKRGEGVGSHHDSIFPELSNHVKKRYSTATIGGCNKTS